MMTAKYIIVNKISPVIFNPSIEHKTEAAGRNITSAGFCEVYLNEDNKLQVCCWGESTSLGGLKSRPDIDQKLIKSTLVKKEN